MFPQTGNMDMGDPAPNPVATPTAIKPGLDYQSLLAAKLRQGAGAAPTGSMVGGQYVAPSATQHMASLLGNIGAGMAYK